MFYVIITKQNYDECSGLVVTLEPFLVLLCSIWFRTFQSSNLLIYITEEKQKLYLLLPDIEVRIIQFFNADGLATLFSYLISYSQRSGRPSVPIRDPKPSTDIQNNIKPTRIRTMQYILIRAL